MKKIKILPVFFAAVLLFTSGCKSDPDTDPGGEPGPGPEPGPVETPAPGTFSFAPNQLAANVWYQPEGRLINGHVDESFGNAGLWPELISRLKETDGYFSVFAAEIGYMSTETGVIPLLKNEGLRLSVELPGFTQCLYGTDLGEAELNGKAVGGTDNIFQRIFQISNPTDRPDPDGKGWFYSSDREDVVPDQILFDERMPNLCPEFDAEKLAYTEGTWQERKNAARRNNFCFYFGMEFNELLDRLRQDYVDFLRVAKTKWGDRMPEIGIHWNVIAAWEWRDENGIDVVNSLYPDYLKDPGNFGRMALTYPQYNSVEYCNMLIDELDAAGFKPSTVLFDVDWIYSVPYLTEVLLRHKTELKARGIQMGINIVEASPSLGEYQELYYDGNTLSVRDGVSGNKNICYENTVKAIMQFLVGSGIYEEGMQIRVTSWTGRPEETGDEVDESREGSMAHAANEVYRIMKGI
ncbi:MAG: hypothetical protein LIO85_02935 [Rikenellaceae bacterium]|nr:hypothetical protein [Rikenellaceae bacterium]